MPRPRRSFLVACLVLAGLVPGAEAPIVRIGDAASVPDPERFDPAYPEMAEWARAGVRGGIPPRKASPVVAVVEPGGDVQEALDAAGKVAREQGLVPARGEGFAGVPVDGRYVVVLVKDGTHEIPATACQNAGYSNQPTGHMLRVPGGVILRGESRGGAVLMFDPPRAKGKPEGRFDGFGAVKMIVVDACAGLEDLTVRNRQVMAMDYALVENLYKNPGVDAAPDLPVLCGQGVSLGRHDSFMQNVAVLDMATCPVNASGVHHTCRDNLVERSWNKGGMGNGYYHTSTGHHSLFYNETVRNLRHVCVQGYGGQENRYHVFVHCRIEVDFNFHNGVIGGVLVQDCHVEPRAGHTWARGDGFQGYKERYADRNLVWRVTPFQPEGIHVIGSPGRCEAQPRPDLEPPADGTLYAVTGVHVPLDQLARVRAARRLARARAARDWAECLRLARIVLDGFAAETAEHAAASELLAELDAMAEREMAEAIADGGARRLKAFLADWGGWDGAAPAREAAAAVAAEEYARISAGTPRADTLLRFIREWPGLPVTEEAVAAYDALAREAYERLPERDVAALKAKYLRRHLDRWDEVAPSLQAVRERYATALEQYLADIRGQRDPRRRYHDLKRLVARHPGTDAAARATELLEEMTSER